MKISLLLDIIEKFLPRETAMEGDRLGLQVQAGNSDVRNLLITMELNDAVVEEAISINADCIIAFHPLIFQPLTQITDSERVGRLLSLLIKNGISLITMHTTFDAYKYGTSRILCDRLGMEYETFLVPDEKYQGYGMGVICSPKEKLSLSELLERLANVCHSPIRYCNGKSDSDIDRIAIVGGSGSSFIDDALQSQVDAFITADVTYHQFHRVAGKMALLDPGHYEMEQFVAKGIFDFLSSKVEPDVKLNLSGSYTNPVIYYPDLNYSEKQKNYILNKF